MSSSRLISEHTTSQTRNTTPRPLVNDTVRPVLWKYKFNSLLKPHITYLVLGVVHSIEYFHQKGYTSKQRRYKAHTFSAVKYATHTFGFRLSIYKFETYFRVSQSGCAKLSFLNFSLSWMTWTWIRNHFTLAFQTPDSLLVQYTPTDVYIFIPFGPAIISSPWHTI
jgi:hypothetical protein